MNATLKRIFAAACATLALAACSKIQPIVAPAGSSGSANFSTYVALGTSITAGVQSGGLVVTHQQKSFAYQFAQQVGTTFTIPSVSPDGLPPLLELQSITPLIISNVGRVAGAPTNFAQPTPYNNMGVPGALLHDALSTDDYTLPERAGAFGLVARGMGPVADQALSLAPTFVSIEYGANEVLGPATNGSGTATTPTNNFADSLSLLVGKIGTVAPNAKVAIVNVPNVASVPYVTTFPAVVLQADGTPVLPLIPLIGSESGSPAPLSPFDHVLLGAADSLAVGCGFPLGTFSYLTGAPGNGRPLLNSQVLSTTEAASIQATVDAYNAIIDTVATNHGAAVVDFNAVLVQASTTGISYRGTTYTNAFITGGLFSLDGVHPTDLAGGIICNAMIDAVNAKFGASIGHVNLSAAASGSSSAMRPWTGDRRVLPWIQGLGGSPGMGLLPWRRAPAF
ncbi:MAG TPA: SGNH/GDSL hydrolase family protein [Candidatus Saccharimonadaceae bacterium]|jgi:lysophospholipase L1-like esterase|nr:SGNH/GDSL hydrolase family protein [Candidatus Saccharimonadaceae bacterium]